MKITRYILILITILIVVFVLFSLLTLRKNNLNDYKSANINSSCDYENEKNLTIISPIELQEIDVEKIYFQTDYIEIPEFPEPPILELPVLPEPPILELPPLPRYSFETSREYNKRLNG